MLVKYLHAIALDGDLRRAGAAPGSQQGFGIGLSYHDDVQWLGTAEV